MTIFYRNSFEEGRWAGALAGLLKRKRYVPGLKPEGRVWRASWHQWVQYEDPTIPGPSFWRGKPAIRANADSLFAGYYVERGLPKNENPDYVLGPRWHWHGFMHCIQSEDQENVNKLIRNFSLERACVWIQSETGECIIRYSGVETLTAVEKEVAKTPADVWVNLMVAEEYKKQECLEHQENIVSRLQKPIVAAVELSEYVKTRMRFLKD